jgi:hypothetical protein
LRCSLAEGCSGIVVGKVFKPNKRKVLALKQNTQRILWDCEAVSPLNSASKSVLHENGYERTKERFNLNTALIQTARDKAVENLEELRKKGKRAAF